MATKRTKCKARREGDTMVCHSCGGLSWHHDDPDRPECRNQNRRITPRDEALERINKIKRMLGDEHNE